jgi:hypothetical protein
MTMASESSDETKDVIARLIAKASLWPDSDREDQALRSVWNLRRGDEEANDECLKQLTDNLSMHLGNLKKNKEQSNQHISKAGRHPGRLIDSSGTSSNGPQIRCEMSLPVAYLFLHLSFDLQKDLCIHLQPPINAGSSKRDKIKKIMQYLREPAADSPNTQDPQVAWYAVKSSNEEDASACAGFANFLDCPMNKGDDGGIVRLLNNRACPFSCTPEDLGPFFDLLTVSRSGLVGGNCPLSPLV